MTNANTATSAPNSNSSVRLIIFCRGGWNGMEWNEWKSLFFASELGGAEKKKMEYLFFSLTFDFSNVFLKGVKLEKNKMINQLSNEDRGFNSNDKRPNLGRRKKKEGRKKGKSDN